MFLTKQRDFDVLWFVELRKQTRHFVTVLAEPKDNTGGTQLRVPPVPWCLNLENPDLTLAEPSQGIRLIRQNSIFGQSEF